MSYYLREIKSLLVELEVSQDPVEIERLKTEINKTMKLLDEKSGSFLFSEISYHEELKLHK